MKSWSLCHRFCLRGIYFFTRPIEINPIFNSIIKGAGLQINISVKYVDYLTTLLIHLPVAKNLMPFMGV